MPVPPPPSSKGKPEEDEDSGKGKGGSAPKSDGKGAFARRGRFLVGCSSTVAATNLA